jgi:hypothetical protein
MGEAGSHARSLELVWEAARKPGELRALAEGLLAACDGRLRAELPDWLGHIKCLVATPSGAAYASLTGAGEPVTWAGGIREASPRATVTLYAAVWGAGGTLVAEAVEKALEGMRDEG